MLNLDEVLWRLSKAIEENNLWDIEAYCEMAITYLNDPEQKTNGSHKNELMNYLDPLLKGVKAESLRLKKISEYEKFKKDLIEQIVNFK